jgi:hypothetical protein
MDRLKSTLKVLANGISVSRLCRVQQGARLLDCSLLGLTTVTVQIVGPEWSLTSSDLMMLWMYYGLWVTQRHTVFDALIRRRLWWISHRVILAVLTSSCSLTHPSFFLRITWVYRLCSNSASVQAIFKIPFATCSGSPVVPLHISTWKEWMVPFIS